METTNPKVYTFYGDGSTIIRWLCTSLLFSAIGSDGRSSRAVSPKYTALPKLLTLDIQDRQTFLHTNSFTHRHFYTQMFLTQMFLNKDPFTHRRLYTQTFLHTDLFRHRLRHTQTFSHTDVLSRRSFDTQTFLYTNSFAQRRFYTKTLYTQRLLHTDALRRDTFTQRGFDT